MIFSRTQKIIIAALVLLVLTTAAVPAFLYWLDNRVPTIVRTNNGFGPKTITIKPGETVLFKNKSDDYFWPASNSHPTHNSLSDFDPGEPLAPGSTWSFTFDTQGPWGFHDHLYPGYKGTIIVGSKDAIPPECLEEDASTNTLLHCWGITATKIVEDEGFEAVFNWFGKKYSDDVAFRDNCHDVTHVIGEIAFDAFQHDKQTIARPETSYCGYGFYHGFIEQALVSFGSDYEQQSRAYCDALRDSDTFETQYAAKAAMDACDHGVGHAVFDSINSAAWGDPHKMIQIGLNTCKRMYADDDSRRVSCGSGVSNSLAKAYAYERYNLVQEGNYDPTVICPKIEREFQRNCYMELGLNTMQQWHLDTQGRLEYINAIPDEVMSAALLKGFIDNEIRYKAGIDRLDKMHDICTSYEDDLFLDECLDGVMVGLRTGGIPGEESGLMIEFCQMFENGSREKNMCLEHMLSKLLGISTEEDMIAVCRLIDPEHIEEQRQCDPYLPQQTTTETRKSGHHFRWL